jgi:hypothetical protein
MPEGKPRHFVSLGQVKTPEHDVGAVFCPGAGHIEQAEFLVYGVYDRLRPGNGRVDLWFEDDLSGRLCPVGLAAIKVPVRG